MLSQEVSALQRIPDVLKAIASVVAPVVGNVVRLPAKGLPNLVAPKTMLNATITSQRAFTARSLSLADAKAVAKETGTKLNDIVMAICAGALRRYLLEKHGLPKEPLVAFVPVSLREPGNTESTNQVSVMLCSLATDIKDPVERLKAIQASSLEAKELSGKVKDATPRDFSIFGAPVVLHGAMELYGRSHLADRLPPAANVVVSNVPGPQAPLYVAGARVLTLYPVSIPTHGMALNLTVQSYCGSLDFGLTACRKTVPELHKLADYLDESLAELHDAVIGSAAGKAAASRPRSPSRSRKRAGSRACTRARSAEEQRSPSAPCARAGGNPACGPQTGTFRAGVDQAFAIGQGREGGTRVERRAAARIQSQPPRRRRHGDDSSKNGEKDRHQDGPQGDGQDDRQDGRRRASAKRSLALPSLGDLSKLVGRLKLPGVDVAAIVESQRKDMEALAEANRQAYEGIKALAQRRNEILRAALVEWQEAMKDATGKDALSKNADRAKQGVKKAIDSFRELAEMEAESRRKAWKVVQDRFQENLANLQNLLKPK